MDSLIHLYLVRHGQTEENLQHILQGHLPGHLTEEGRNQMKLLGEKLSSTHFDNLLCSDLQRAVNSAQYLGLPLPIVTTPLLRERDWGTFTGRKIDTIKRDEVFPESVESIPQMYSRAVKFIEFLLHHYEGKNVLCVGHGLFNRFITAVVKEKPYYEIPRFGNSDCQQLTIDKKPDILRINTLNKDEASAN